MDLLFPAHEPDANIYDIYRPEPPHRPWLRLDMVSSVDGAATDAKNRSGGLGGPGDLEVFRTMRAQADVVLVGAETIRKEKYGPYKLPDYLHERRAADGRSGPAPYAIVTASLNLDPTWPLFTEVKVPTIVLTGSRADPDRRAALDKVATVIECGDDRVDLPQAVGALRDAGYAHILCEGGPFLNHGLLDAGLVDEICVTLAAQLVSGVRKRMTDGLGNERRLRLTTAATAGEDLFLRYAVGEPISTAR